MICTPRHTQTSENSVSMTSPPETLQKLLIFRIRLWVPPMLPTHYMGMGAYQSLFRPKKELLTIRECFLRFVHVFKKFEIFGKNCPWGGHMQKFRPQEGCAWCVHILGMERDCLLGSFKVMKYILDRFWARGYSARPPRPKSAHFRPKIADLPKFRCRNFGRGCPERPKTFFWTTKLHYFRQKNFHGRTKILSSSFKNSWEGKKRPFFSPPSTFFTRI